jgi:hypothetical protein
MDAGINDDVEVKLSEKKDISAELCEMRKFSGSEFCSVKRGGKLGTNQALSHGVWRSRGLDPFIQVLSTRLRRVVTLPLRQVYPQ